MGDNKFKKGEYYSSPNGIMKVTGLFNDVIETVHLRTSGELDFEGYFVEGSETYWKAKKASTEEVRKIEKAIKSEELYKMRQVELNIASLNKQIELAFGKREEIAIYFDRIMRGEEQ